MRRADAYAEAACKWKRCVTRRFPPPLYAFSLCSLSGRRLHRLASPFQANGCLFGWQGRASRPPEPSAPPAGRVGHHCHRAQRLPSPRFYGADSNSFRSPFLSVWGPPPTPFHPLLRPSILSEGCRLAVCPLLLFLAGLSPTTYRNMTTRLTVTVY